MSTNKTMHTPGPWSYTTWAKHLIKAGEVASVFAIDENGEDGDTICDMDQFCEQEERKANANLIAASPDLLSALQQCLAYIERDEQRHGRQLPEGRAARNAIKKATGEE